MRRLVLALMVAVTLVLIASPVLARSAGEPPGWSQVNPGQGGSAGSGQGPGK